VSPFAIENHCIIAKYSEAILAIKSMQGVDAEQEKEETAPCPYR